jgi:RNA polymerase sigma-70 factor (ECF subfamily)
MSQADAAPGWEPERYLEYLRVLARLQVGRHRQGRLDASDLVQQTLLEARQKLHQFRGSSEAELAAWLRRILAHNLADAERALRRGKRDVARQRSLEAALGESSARLGAWLRSEESSPSQKAQRNEEAVLLAEALARLPEPQREAVVLRHLEGRSLVEIAERLGRTQAAVVGLLQRGLRNLRELLQERE